MTQFKISFQNSGGELDCRLVDTEEEIRGAALELVSEVASMHDGDRIVVTEIDTAAAEAAAYRIAEDNLR